MSWPRAAAYFSYGLAIIGGSEALDNRNLVGLTMATVALALASALMSWTIHD